MEIAKNEIAAIEEKLAETESQQLLELQLVLVGGGQGEVCF